MWVQRGFLIVNPGVGNFESLAVPLIIVFSPCNLISPILCAIREPSSSRPRKSFFVVPFDFQRELVLAKVFHMIDFMRDRLTFGPVDDFPYLKDELVPSDVVKGAAHPLSSFSLAAT